MWGCFLMSGIKILHFLKDWWKSIPIHQNYMALKVVDPICKYTQMSQIMQGWKIYYYDDVYEIL